MQEDTKKTSCDKDVNASSNASITGNYFLGAHISIGKGLYTVQEQMNMLKASTCGLFLKSQRTYNFKKIDDLSIKKFVSAVEMPEMLLPHSSYLINLANNNENLTKSMDLLVDDLQRCNSLGIKMYNIHPGSDTNRIGKRSLKLIAENLNKAFAKIPNVRVLIENMAGQGNCLGSKFEEIREIIDNIEDKDRIGVCLDTCHLFAAGYDIRTSVSFDNVIQKFDELIGLKYLKAMHLNDSKNELNSKKDRHECIGKGKIGLEAFKFIMTNPIFENMPLILETPNPAIYCEEISLLKSFIKK